MFDLTTAVTVAAPYTAALVIYGVHVDNRVSALETKIDLIMAYFHLEPKKKGGE